jgi:hypothetical protein
MVRTASGRLCGFIAAFVLAVGAAAGQPLSSGAAATGTLFAITGPNQSVLSRLDPLSGTITPIEDLAGPNQGQLVTITGDPLTHRIFAVRTTVTFDPNGISITNELLTINSQTGAFTVSPPINQPVGQIAFDPSARTLYLLGINGIFVLDPTTGATTLVATLPNVSGGILSMAVVPGGHTIYVNNLILIPDAATDQILTIDTQTGSVSTSPNLAQPVRIIIEDATGGSVFGASECCPRQLVRIDPASGNEVSVTTFDNNRGASLQFAMALDPATHTVFMDEETFVSFFTSQDQIVSINDQTGATTVSPAINDIVWSQYFEPVVVITADSIKADVSAALAAGAIARAGVATSLLAKLDAASAARALGQCSTAAQAYRAFINELHAQSGKSVATGTASQLMDEAQFLIDNCP